jgi:anti-sigma regulatory factor (Ser/Thr protein kinase)/biotin operon repressor
MSRVRPRGEQIRQFILDHVDRGSTDIARSVSAEFGISRQAANKHLQRLVKQGALKSAGKTRRRRYELAALVEWRKRYAISSTLTDDLVWSRDVRPALGDLPDNVLNIWQTVFTEIFNNAIEHSGGSAIVVSVHKSAAQAEMSIFDDGVGIFAKIRKAFDLPDEQHAVLELAKGKLTTDPKHHSGEGIFFSSRMVDDFVIGSGDASWTHHYGDAEDFILDFDRKGRSGTIVGMTLSNHAARTAKQVYDQFTSGDDYGFTKTVVPVKLARFGSDALVSRSQAKRVVARIDQFRTVMLDFQDVPSIGQAFADEIFRVFRKAHPEVELHVVNANDDVQSMITHVNAAISPETAT